jgi:plastocyanin
MSPSQRPLGFAQPPGPPRLIRRAWLGAAGLALSGAACAALVDVLVQDGAGKPLPGAAVFLESKEARAASRPAAGVDIVQSARQFQPRVTVVPVGTAVHFPNRDTVRHHVYSFSPVKKFEIKLYVGTPAAPVVFDQPGIAALGCNIHDTMAAWVVVVETPYHAITGADGRAQLAAVPPGHYRLRTWHPALPPGAPALDQALPLAAANVALTVPMAGVQP